MKMLLMLLGTIFLALIFIFATLFLLFWLWSRKLQNKFSNGELEMQGHMTSESLDIFYEIPILGNLFRKHSESMRTGIDYFNHSIPQILSNWDSRELVKRAAPQFLDSLETGEPEKSFNSYFHDLGKLKSYTGIKQIEGSDYVAEASFEKGLAQIQVQLTQNEKEWLINSFKIHYLFQLYAYNS
jgi:hypothetical protein